MLLKGEIGPKIVAIGAVVEEVCKGRGSGSLGRRRSSRIRHELATIIAAIDHDRPRSDHDRASIVLQILNKMLIDGRGIDSTTNGVRSRLDRTTILEFFHNSS